MVSGKEALEMWRDYGCLSNAYFCNLFASVLQEIEDRESNGSQNGTM